MQGLYRVFERKAYRALIQNQQGATMSEYSIEIERTFQGAWRISAMIDGYLVSKQYMGYTKKEAVALFQQQHPES